jgi:seryl-tRNA synthetase
MLDIAYVRKHLKEVEHSTQAKGYDVDVAGVVGLDERRRKLLVRVEGLREERNKIAGSMGGGKPSADVIRRGREVKEELAKMEGELSEVEKELAVGLAAIPNVIGADVPLGGEEDAVVVREWGEKKAAGVDHLDYAVGRGWVDFERGARVAGAKFYYIRGELALLENALVQFVLAKVLGAGFVYMSTVPQMVKGEVLTGTGFNPRSSRQSDEYFVEGEDLAMIATAEIPLTGYHMGEILEEKDLPLLYAGYSACYRKEAGTYGKFTRGLYRVHQFNKVEMYVFCVPERSGEMHERILAIEEEIWQELGLAYRVVNIAAGDLGAPAAKKYDVEWWSPVDKKYRELTSCSNCTDYQARNLNIRVRREGGKIEVVHTLNGTAVSLARTLMAVMENYAVAGGKMVVPEVLRGYLGGREEI